MFYFYKTVFLINIEKESKKSKNQFLKSLN